MYSARSAPCMVLATARSCSTPRRPLSSTPGRAGCALDLGSAWGSAGGGPAAGGGAGAGAAAPLSGAAPSVDMPSGARVMPISWEGATGFGNDLSMAARSVLRPRPFGTAARDAGTPLPSPDPRRRSISSWTSWIDRACSSMRWSIRRSTSSRSPRVTQPASVAAASTATAGRFQLLRVPAARVVPDPAPVGSPATGPAPAISQSDELHNLPRAHALGDDAGAECQPSLLLHQPFARREDPERPPQALGQLATLEQERGLARMADGALLDQERVPEQSAAGTQPAGNLGEEPAVEEAHHDDVRGRAGAEAGRVEVHLDAGDPGGSRPHVRETGPRHVDGNHHVAAGGEERGVAPRARGEVEGASRDQQVR